METVAFPSIFKPTLHHIVTELLVDSYLTMDFEDTLEYSNERYQITFRWDGCVTAMVHDRWALENYEDSDGSESHWYATFDMAAPGSVEGLQLFLLETIKLQEWLNAS